MRSQIDGLAEAVTILTSAESEAELQSAIRTVEDQAEPLLTEISDRLDC